MKRKGIFELIKEAEEDENGSSDNGGSTDSEAGQDQAPSPETSGEDASSSDDDFNMNTNLDDMSSDDSGGDDMDMGGDSSSDSSSDSLDSGEDTQDKEIPANTDMFSSLSPEEQQMKIMELKNLFSNLYSSTDDILNRINQTNTDESNLEVISRITSSLYSLRKYMSDYITQVFPNKSFIENDITFNRFLAIVNGITIVIEELGKMNKQDD